MQSQPRPKLFQSPEVVYAVAGIGTLISWLFLSGFGVGQLFSSGYSLLFLLSSVLFFVACVRSKQSLVSASVIALIGALLSAPFYIWVFWGVAVMNGYIFLLSPFYLIPVTLPAIAIAYALVFILRVLLDKRFPSQRGDPSS